MSGTGDVGPANGGPAEEHPAEEHPAEEHPAEANPAGGGAHGRGPADGAADSGLGGEASEGTEAAADSGDLGSAGGGARGGGSGDESREAGVLSGSRSGASGDGTSAGATAVPAGPTDPGELLGEMRAIRRRARLARHAYWFPLVLFGLLTLASVPFYIRRFPVGGGVVRLGPGLGLLQSRFLGGAGLIDVADGTAYYWLAAMLLGITATVLWYRWRGNRIGLRTPARGYLITGLTLLALALLIPIVSGRSFRLPLLWPGSYVRSNLFPLLLIGLGLFVLAWSERSTGLAAIAVGYFAVALVANVYFLSNVLYRLHWDLNPAAADVPNVVLPALVLLLAGAVAWVVQRRYRPPAEPEPAAG
jgi:hypothetical protein